MWNMVHKPTKNRVSLYDHANNAINVRRENTAGRIRHVLAIHAPVRRTETVIPLTLTKLAHDRSPHGIMH